MPAIPESYASPNMRLGLLLTDCPEATVSFQALPGSDLGIPAAYGGDADYCVATIHFPASDPRNDTRGWKEMPPRGDSEKWEVLCTKALGRALKRAGYPGDTDDLKVVVLWRKRNAEVAALGAGAPVSWANQPAIGAGEAERPDEVQRALAAAATVDRSGQDVIDVDSEDVLLARELIEGLDDNDAELFEGYLETIGANPDPAKMTPSQLDDVIAWLEGPSD